MARAADLKSSEMFLKNLTIMSNKFSLPITTQIAILVAALGYFVDVYDLVLFSVVRSQSLQALGYTGEELLNNGVILLNAQMLGMLLGGVFWGVLADKFGRIQVLFGSILLYSGANVANAFVTDIVTYEICRFLAGVGLAGEVGAGITLVSELLPKEQRGVGTTIVATVGVFGAVVASAVAGLFSWSTSYIVGGCLGLILLVLRVSVAESRMFLTLHSAPQTKRGDLRLLFCSGERFVRYLSALVIGVPCWYVVGILVTFSPEIGKALHIPEPVTAGSSIFYCYLGFTLGDLASGLASQFLRSRRKVMLYFVAGILLLTLTTLNTTDLTTAKFYCLIGLLGFFGGYWAVFITSAAEQFGTNLRGTVATTSPNFVRGSTVIMTLIFSTLNEHVGILGSAQIVGVLACLVAAAGILYSKETFSRDLEFVEQ